MLAPLSERHVLVTGGSGFVGRSVLRELAEGGCASVAAPSSEEFDLTRPGEGRRPTTEQWLPGPRSEPP